VAQKTISELTEATDLSPSHVVAVDTGTQTFKMRADNLVTALKKNSKREFISRRGTYTVPAGVTRLSVSSIERTSGKMFAAGGGVLLQRNDGTLLGSGLNLNGELGDGTNIRRSSPVTQAGNHAWAPLRWPGSFYDRAIMLKADGTAWSHGANANGALGHGDLIARSSPTMIAAGRYRTIGPGRYDQSFLQHIGGDWLGMGINTSGQLGDVTVVSKSSPVAVVTTNALNRLIYGANNSGASMYGINESNGQGFAWGENNSGMLGDNTIVSKSSPVAIIGAIRFANLVSENDNSGRVFGLLKNGKIMAWGSNGGSGALGDGSGPLTTFSSPVAVAGPQTWIWVRTRNGGGMGIDAANKLWTWGGDQYGSLGINQGGLVYRSSPVAVLGGYEFKNAWDTQGGLFALDLDGNVYSCGFNFYGYLGQGTQGVHVSSPVLVQTPEPIDEIFANTSNNIFARGVSGAMYGWGRNQNGELGLNNRVAQSSPVAVFQNFVDSNPSFVIIETKVLGVTPGQQITHVLTAAGFQFGHARFDVCDALMVEVNG
jgi:alpha-tubulin suppressor-like RCC1 family protein